QEYQARLDELQRRLADAQAAEARLPQILEEHDARYRELQDQHKQLAEAAQAPHDQERAELREELARALGEQCRLSEIIEQHDRERHQSLSQKDQEYQARLEELQQRLTGALAEQERLPQILEQHDARYRELQDSHAHLAEVDGTRHEHELAGLRAP